MAETRDSMSGACKEFEPDLVLYYYQDCTETERRRVESHLDSCTSCRRFLAELQSFLPETVKTDEPSPAFWQSYSREIRAKLAAEEEKKSWWRTISFFRPWPVPALATATILAFALTLTFTKGRWFDHQPTQEPAPIEVAAENLDFFKSLDFLDSMDLLEAVEGKEAQKSETSAHSL